MSFSEILTALRFTEFSTRSALKRLVKEGKVVRTGVRATTRHAARGEAAGSVARLPGRGPDHDGTLQGRLVELKGPAYISCPRRRTGPLGAQAICVPRWVPIA